MREKMIDIVLQTPCVAVSSRTAVGHIVDNLIAHGVTIQKKKQKVKPRKIKHNAITTEAFLALEKIGKQSHRGEQK